MPILGILMGLIKYGPDAIAFAQSTYEMFANGEMTAEELEAKWKNATSLAAKGEADWAAA